jgi:hypothetical protein
MRKIRRLQVYAGKRVENKRLKGKWAVCGCCGSNLGLLRVNVLKTKDRGGTGIPARSRAVASAAVAVKGLRFAPMNGQRTPALDRHPRCGWFAAMRKMYFSHVPHDGVHGDHGGDLRGSGARGAVRSGGEACSSGAVACIRGASGGVLEQDTIPCADAQGGPRCGLEPNGNRPQPGRCATLCSIRSSQVRASSGAGSRAVQR